MRSFIISCALTEAKIDLSPERYPDAANSSSPIVHIDYEKAYKPGFEDMQRRVPSIDKVQQLIGFNPNGNLDGILNEIIAHMKEGN